MSDAYDKTASVISGAMGDAWFKIWRDLADAAQSGSAIEGPVTFGSIDDIRGLFAELTSAEIEVRFRLRRPRQTTETVRVRSAQVDEHEVALIVRSRR